MWDVDTIGPEGLENIDFADGAQFPINPAGEKPWTNKKSITDVTVDEDIFEAYLDGYLEAYPGTDTEKRGFKSDFRCGDWANNIAPEGAFLPK